MLKAYNQLIKPLNDRLAVLLYRWKPTEAPVAVRRRIHVEIIPSEHTAYYRHTSFGNGGRVVEAGIQFGMKGEIE